MSTISQEYLLEFTSEYGITEDLIGIASAAKVDERVFPTIVDWRINAPSDEMPVEGSYSVEDVAILDTQLTPIQKQLEPLFAPNPTKVKIGTRPRAAHEVPLLTSTASRVIDMEEPATATECSGTSSTIEKSPLDFDNENPSQQITESDGPEDQVQETVAPEILPLGNVSAMGAAPTVSLEEEVVAMGPRLSKKHRKRGNDRAEANAPPKVLKKDHATSRPTQSILGGKSLTSMGVEPVFTSSAPASQETPVDVSDPDPLSYAKPRSIPERDIAQSSKGAAVAGDPDSENITLTGTASGYGFLNWRLMVLARSQMRAREPQKKIAKHEQRIQARKEEIKKLDQEIKSLRAVDSEVQGLHNQTSNLKTLLEAEADIKKAAEAQNADLSKELESLRTELSDLQVNNNQLSQQVSNLQAQVTGEERIKAAFEDFKKYEYDKVEGRCAEMDARLDALSIDFDEELYPHVLTAIAGRRWVIEHGLHLAVMKCVVSIELRLRHSNVAALHALKDLKYPLINQLEKLKDAPLDLIMAFLHLESDTGEDTPQWICELRPSSSQLTVPIYPEVRDPKNPWGCKEEILLGDVITANVSGAEKKKKCRVVCRTHGISSGHHARSDGVPVLVPTVVPQGLAILVADAATQTEAADKEDEPRPRPKRSLSLPPA
ncbi:hypothetical protein Tco_0615715 [Tanacetum coccineum]